MMIYDTAMNRIKIRIKTITGTLLAAMLAAVFMTGCIQEYDNCPDNNRGPLIKKGMTLNFTLLTRGVNKTSGTRSVVAPPNPQDGTAAENFLDIPNMTFLLFKEDKSLLAAFTPEVTPENAAYTTYDVTYTVPETLFDYITGDVINIYIMAIGNAINHGVTDLAFLPLEKMFENTATFPYPLAGGTQADGGSQWIPDFYANRGIPMSGMQYFSIPRDALENSSYENPLNLSEDLTVKNDLNMLRSVAKIEIIDMFDGTDGNASTTPVNLVRLHGYNGKGGILPTLSQWNFQTPWETQYVKNPSVPFGAAFNNSNAIVFFKDDAAQALRDDKRPVYSAYLPEFDSDAQGVTVPKITVSLNSGNGGTIDRTFELREYNNGNPGTASDLLRNNIYRYEVRVNTSLDLLVTVCPRATFTINVPTFE